jgi:hypothetical protein
MTTTKNAARLATYRQRHLKEGTDCILSAIVSAHCKAALSRLARHHGTTQRALLERLVAEAEGELVAGLPVAEHRPYYGD